MSELHEQADPGADELRKAFREILSMTSGKRVIFWMLEQCAIYRDPFSGDDAATNYTIGRQAAGRMLISMLESIDPRLYPRLLLDIAEIREVDRSTAKALQQNQENDDDED